MAEVGADIDTGVVDDDVEALVLLLDGAQERRDVLAARNVDGHRRGAKALGDKRLRRLPGALPVNVGDVDVGALGGEQLGRGKADAGRRPGDERDLVVQPGHGCGLLEAVAT